jgi:hypothetical protein
LWFKRRISNLARVQDEATNVSAHEHKIIYLLCVLAAIHVFVFSAAFPFFNNVDEPLHFDLVIKYAHGHVPLKLETLSEESSICILLYSSGAYLFAPSDFPDGQWPSPLWLESTGTIRQNLEKNLPGCMAQQNFEATQPPLYYALAALWWKAGQCLGLAHAQLLYWLRFLNMAGLAALVWLAYLTARSLFPGQAFIRFGVPSVLAFMPQTAFYSIGNDLPSAVTFGMVFLLLIKFFSAEIPSARLGAMLGLALAATFLAKMTNLPLLAAALAAILFQTWRLSRAGKFRASVPAFVAILVCAAPPAIAWMAWCKSNYGDFTGSRLKVEYLDWTLKPFSQWWHHPIFSPAGLWIYLSGQLGTFWQGEFSWHTLPMTWPAANAVYTFLSIILPVIGLAIVIRRWRETAPLQREALGFSFIIFFGMLLFYALTSIAYDFDDCPNPSRAHPYFQAGRMFLGVLIPFLVLFVYAIDRVLNRFGPAAKFFTLSFMIVLMLVTEVATDWPAFSNSYNWFHL